MASLKTEIALAKKYITLLIKTPLKVPKEIDKGLWDVHYIVGIMLTWLSVVGYSIMLKGIESKLLVFTLVMILTALTVYGIAWLREETGKNPKDTMDIRFTMYGFIVGFTVLLPLSIPVIFWLM